MPRGASISLQPLSCPPTAVRYPPTAVGHPPTAVRYPPNAVGHPPTAVGYAPTAVGHPLTAVRYPPTAVGHPPTAVRYPPTAVGHPPTAVGYAPTAVGYPPTAIGHPPTAVGYPPQLRPGSHVKLCSEYEAYHWLQQTKLGTEVEVGGGDEVIMHPEPKGAGGGGPALSCCPRRIPTPGPRRVCVVFGALKPGARPPLSCWQDAPHWSGRVPRLEWKHPRCTGQHQTQGQKYHYHYHAPPPPRLVTPCRGGGVTLTQKHRKYQAPKKSFPWVLPEVLQF